MSAKYNMHKVLLALLVLLFKSQHSFAQDSSLIKINYQFSYDYHNYKGLYETYAKSGFCYSNRFGLQLNHYFFKKKRWGVGFQLTVGNKQMRVTSDYSKLISTNSAYGVYETNTDYSFKYDYWHMGSELQFKYKINSHFEAFIGVERDYCFLNKKNFESDSIKILIDHGSKYYYVQTYVLPKKLFLNGISSGINFNLSTRLQIGLRVSYLYDPSPNQYQGEERGAILFNKFSLLGFQINYSVF